jgi:hypothetical protein
MRFKYSTSDPDQDEFDSLPRIPFVLRKEGRFVDTVGLVDSGATVSVLPYELGVRLGATWDDDQAVIRLAGSLGDQPAIPLLADVEIGSIPPVS